MNAYKEIGIKPSIVQKLRLIFHVIKFHFSASTFKYLFFFNKKSYFEILSSIQNKHSKKRCFIVGSGPSLNKMKLEKLKGEHVISVNAGFKKLIEVGIEPSYLIIEDVKTAYNIAENDDLKKLKDTTILVAIHNAYLDFKRNDIIYYRTNYPGNINYYFVNGVSFSTEFHHIAFLGGAVIYQALQLAFHLGFSEVYLIGVDFNYGDQFQKKFQDYQGKVVTVDEEILEILKSTHFDKKYLSYKIGEKLNIPHWDLQRQSFITARETFEKHGRTIFNAGVDSRLEVYNCIDFNSLF